MRVFAVLAAFALATGALAQPYTDSPTANWFKALQAPWVANCCDQADCKLAESDYRDGSWWAKSNRTGDWVRIEPGNITTTVSIFAKAVLCEGNPLFVEAPEPPHYEARVYCFAPPPIGAT